METANPLRRATAVSHPPSPTAHSAPPTRRRWPMATAPEPQPGRIDPTGIYRVLVFFCFSLLRLVSGFDRWPPPAQTLPGFTEFFFFFQFICPPLRAEMVCNLVVTGFYRVSTCSISIVVVKNGTCGLPSFLLDDIG